MTSTIFPPYRILVAVPFDASLNANQRAIKSTFLSKLQQDGFEPQILGEIGQLQSVAWSFDNVRSVIGRCQGAVVLGLTRFEFLTELESYRFTTEYSHVEGAIALAHKVPLFIVREVGVAQRGILYYGGGKMIAEVPDNGDMTWSEPNSQFTNLYTAWRNEVKGRYHLFLGYSGKAIGTAALIKNYLQSNGVQVLDWATDFMSRGTILTQIEQADSLCMGGLFLFTKDDELVTGDMVSAAPRDNVIFEAGYFMNSKGDNRVLIIREEDAKMPADLGGQIYLSLRDRNDISSIETKLLKFVKDRL